MPQELTTQSHIGADGVLHLEIETVWEDTDVEVVIKPMTESMADIARRTRQKAQERGLTEQIFQGLMQSP